MEWMFCQLPSQAWLGFIISGPQVSSWSGDPHFHGYSVTWALMATTVLSLQFLIPTAVIPGLALL